MQDTRVINRPDSSSPAQNDTAARLIAAHKHAVEAPFQ